MFSAALTSAVLASDGIEYQQLAIDMRTQLHRFVCATCGRKGCWLERPEVARRNGQRHAQEHAPSVRP